MSVHANLSGYLPRFLAAQGFDAILQQRSADNAGDLDVSTPSWVDLATVKAVWDNPRRMWKGVSDGAPAASATRYMTIAYRDDLKATSSAVGLRVVVNGVATNVLAIAEIGERVGLRLLLDLGTEPA